MDAINANDFSLLWKDSITGHYVLVSGQNLQGDGDWKNNGSQTFPVTYNKIMDMV